MAVVVVISSEQVVISEHARKRCFQLQNTKLTPELMAHVRSSIERTLPQGSVVRIDTYEHDEHHADIRVIHGADIDRLWYICVIDAFRSTWGAASCTCLTTGPRRASASTPTTKSNRSTGPNRNYAPQEILGAFYLFRTYTVVFNYFHTC